MCSAAIWSPSVPVVKSRWSVKATAGTPAASACSQLRRIDASAGASHDHSVCTWLSGGSTLPIVSSTLTAQPVTSQAGGAWRR